MKQQVARFSPHQNGKVIAVLMAVTSLIFILPFFLLASAFGANQAGMPIWAVFILPIIYLIFGYISVAIGCLLYNVVVPFVGGIEYEPATPKA
ncbi:MAG: hypothetical protein ABJA61_06385 [Caldimonas sp.]